MLEKSDSNTVSENLFWQSCSLRTSPQSLARSAMSRFLLARGSSQAGALNKASPTLSGCLDLAIFRLLHMKPRENPLAWVQSDQRLVRTTRQGKEVLGAAGKPRQ